MRKLFLLLISILYLNLNGQVHTAGSSGLDANADVYYNKPLEDGEVLIWNSATGRFENGFDIDSIDGNLVINGNLNVTGDIVYQFRHLVAYKNAASYTPSITQNVYTKLVPGMTAYENDGLTFQGDSLRILLGGDYDFYVELRVSGTNVNDFWRIKIYINGAAQNPELSEKIWRQTAANVTDTRSFRWYIKELNANDWISFRITNTTASRNPTIATMYIEIEKKPEH